MDDASGDIPQTYTVSAALARASALLGASSSPHLDAQLLLGHVLDRGRSRLIAHGDQHLSAEHLHDFCALIRRRERGEPVAYLRGHVEWFDLDLVVDDSVLVPRPETEILLEVALKAVPAGPFRIADVGTGSGALSIGLARARPEASVIATDVSEDALQVARRNVERYGLADRVTISRGDLLEPMPVSPDLIVANLPYLSEEMMSDIDQDVRHEPTNALLAGETGLELYARMFDQMTERGWVVPCFTEIDPRQRDDMIALLRTRLPSGSVQIFEDYAGLSRVTAYYPQVSCPHE